MKSKLGLNVFLTLGILCLGLPVFAKFSTQYSSFKTLKDTIFLTFNPILKIGNGCSGYLFPGTNVIWTLNKCLSIKDENKEIINLITSSELNYKYFQPPNNETIEVRDTFKKPEILFQYNDWVLLKVDLPSGSPDSSNFYINKISNLKDTTIIGYPELTDYASDAVKNYVDWILLPLWQYQLDTFLNSLNQQNGIFLYDIRNKSSINRQELKENNKEYLIDIRKSEVTYLRIYTTNKAIEFCQKKWTDNHYIRNRIATLSSLEESPSKLSKLEEFIRAENKMVETQGLAASLYLTFSLLPIDLLPSIAQDIILTFQKDYLKAAQFLMSQPNVLNQINLAIRKIPYLPNTSPKTRPKWNQQDTIINGTGALQFIQKTVNKDIKNNGYWTVPGMEGAPVFSNGKLLGIQEEIPFYYTREFIFERELKFISVKELMNMIEQEKKLDILKKISGLIQE
jgi:hypothetical protein